jgi:GMP synthase (glutamine-hydrolysing)
VLNDVHDLASLVVGKMRVTRETAALLREVDNLVTRRLGSAPGISQAFAVLLPLSSGDGRASVAIRAVISNDFMTCLPAALGSDISWPVLHEIVDEIARDFPGIDLVLYDVTAKPPATVEWQ